MNTRIAIIRKNSKLTQEQFGQRMGISKNYVNLIENGKKNPGDRLISDICREFSVNEEWLRTGKGEMQSIPADDYTSISVDIAKNDKKARQAIIDYWNLSEQDKELFWKFVYRFIKKDEGS